MELNNDMALGDVKLCLYFGGFKHVNDIKRGDILMSKDSLPIIVINTEKKYNKMYEIIPEHNESFTIGETQKISLYNTATERIISISLEDYLIKDHEWKKNYYLIQNTINYQRTDIHNDPYLIGMVATSKAPLEMVIKQYLMNKLDSLSKYVNESVDLKLLNLSNINNDEIDQIYKSGMIPNDYLYTSRDNRVRLLQGIMDNKVNNMVPTIKRSRSRSLDRTQKSISKHIRSKSGQKPQVQVRKSLLAKTKDELKRAEPKKVDIRDIKSDTKKAERKDEKKGDQLNSTQPIPIRSKSNIPVLKKDQTTIATKNIESAKQIQFLARGLGYLCVYDGQLTITKPHLQLLKFKINELDMDQSVILHIDKSTQFVTNGCVTL